MELNTNFQLNNKSIPHYANLEYLVLERSSYFGDYIRSNNQIIKESLFFLLYLSL